MSFHSNVSLVIFFYSNDLSTGVSGVLKLPTINKDLPVPLNQVVNFYEKQMWLSKCPWEEAIESFEHMPRSGLSGTYGRVIFAFPEDSPY